MTKTIVTHRSVDLDAVTSVWLIKTFLPDWESADVVFVASRTNWNNIPVDSDPSVIYVDTGLGKFDHHQTTEHTCASERVFHYLVEQNHINLKIEKGLRRLIRLVTELDHFAECQYPEPDADRYDIGLHQLIGGLKYSVQSDATTVNLSFPFLEAALQVFISKVQAEDEIQKGFVLTSVWGKSLILSTANKEAMKLAQKKGYSLVVTKDPDKGYVRIKIPPHIPIDLEPLYQAIIKEDAKASWYFHVSKHMLLNDASQNTDSIPSSLSVSQLIEIIKKI